MSSDIDNLQERLDHIKKITEKHTPSPNLKAIWELQNKDLEETSIKNPEDNIHWEQFKSKHKFDKYFNLQHIKEIGLSFDVAMILTKRGTGKTFSFMNELKNIVTDGKQFVIVRNTKQEIEGGVMEQFFENNCPFEIIKNKVYLDGTKQVVGYLAHLNGKSQQWQGASYEKVDAIFWDEATNGGANAAEDAKWIRAFWQLTSTFFRNKIGGKVWIFGNLMKDAQQKISNSLHLYLGLDIEDNFKYLLKTTPNNNVYRLLYINAGSLYIGADEHLMSNISISREIRGDLSSNMPSKMGECILPEYYFTKAKRKLFGILTTFDKKDWMILIATEPFFNLKDPIIKERYIQGEFIQAESEFFLIRCEVLHKSMMGFEMEVMFTDDYNLWNLHKDIFKGKRPLEGDKMKEKWVKLFKIIKTGRACYIGDHSYINLARIMNGRKESIEAVKKARQEKVKRNSRKKSR